MRKRSPPRRDPKRQPSHPGGLLREFVLPELNRPMTEIAKALGISRQLLYSIVNEKAPITPEVAVRLGKLVGNGPNLWVNMQAAHDLWKAQREVDVSRIPTLAPREAAE
jgi:addiction module HigA family antidote